MGTAADDLLASFADEELGLCWVMSQAIGLHPGGAEALRALAGRVLAGDLCAARADGSAPCPYPREHGGPCRQWVRPPRYDAEVCDLGTLSRDRVHVELEELLVARADLNLAQQWLLRQVMQDPCGPSWAALAQQIFIRDLCRWQAGGQVPCPYPRDHPGPCLVRQGRLRFDVTCPFPDRTR